MDERGFEDPEKLRATLEYMEERIAHQRDALEDLNGRERELSYWHIREQERKLARCWEMLEEIEESTFARDVLRDIDSL